MTASLPALTIYSARICPWAQRATLALREVGAYANNQVDHVEIDLQNKPEWYASKVNPASKVPVLQIGREGEKDTKYIPESGVLLELVAELFPASGLSPSDPVARAEARYFAERFTQLTGPPSFAATYKSDLTQIPALLSAIESVQALLAQHEGTFLLGDQISIGDLAVAPFVGRLFANAKAGILPNDLYTTLTTDPTYAPFKAYHDALTSRPSWKETFDEEYVIEFTRKRIESMKEQQ